MMPCSFHGTRTTGVAVPKSMAASIGSASE